MGGAAGVILLVAVVAAVVVIIRRCLRLQAEKAKSSFEMKENTAYEIVHIQHVHSRAETTMERDPDYETVQ